MKITVLAIGKTDEKYIQQGIEMYLRRVQIFFPVDLEIIEEPKNHAKLSISEQIEKEAQLIEQRLTQQDLIILLDEKGNSFTSEAFAKQLERWIQSQKRRLVFVIGGSNGLHGSLKSKHLLLSLSAMTFNHQMVRLILLEQLYRAFTIIKGHPYHK